MKRLMLLLLAALIFIGAMRCIADYVRGIDCLIAHGTDRTSQQADQ